MENNNKIYHIHIPKEQEITIKIYGLDYTIIAKFSSNDLKNYFNDITYENSHTALCNIIYKKLENNDCSNLPSKEDLFLENEENFKPYIDSVLLQDQNLHNFYLNTDINLPISERFEMAIRENLHMINNMIMKNIRSAFQPYLKMSEQINKTFDLTWNKKIQQISESNKLQFKKLTEQSMKASTIIQDTLSKFLNDLAVSIAKIKIPSIDEEEKQELQLSYKFWGSQGWTIPPNAPITLFKEKPVTKKECDVIALSYLKKNDLSELFKDLNCLKIKDIESALFCFENRQYKACSLLLFSIIDYYLIKKQTKGVKRKKVGLGAVKELEKNISIKDND